MPKLIEKSISILSDAGLGMAMFSLGTYPNDITPLHPKQVQKIWVPLIQIVGLLLDFISKTKKEKKKFYTFLILN